MDKIQNLESIFESIYTIGITIKGVTITISGNKEEISKLKNKK